MANRLIYAINELTANNSMKDQRSVATTSFIERQTFHAFVVTFKLFVALHQHIMIE